MPEITLYIPRVPPNEAETALINSPHWGRDTPATAVFHPGQRCYREIPKRKAALCPSGKHVCFDARTGQLADEHIDSISPAGCRNSDGSVGMHPICAPLHGMADVLYGTITRPRPSELGGWLDTLIQAGVQAGTQAGMTLLAGGGAPQGGPARGTAAITAFGNQVVQTLQQLLQQLRAGQADLSQVKNQAGQLRATLDNSQYVYQAQHGDDAAALTSAKNAADGLVLQINSLADQYSAGITGSGSTPTQPAAPAGTVQTGGTVPAAATNSTLIFGYPAEYVVIAGAVVFGGVWFLTRG